jgi:glycosyltransferase involved in cell wall biosynthesis
MNAMPTSAFSVDVPLVSAVITTYNYGSFVAGAIEGVLAQTYQRVETIVIDDGSTDSTKEVVARYADCGVRYIHQRNAGAASARNHGLAASSGPLVAFCDADDVWLPDKLDVQYEHLRCHPAVALVSGHAYACDVALHPLSVVHAARGVDEDIFEALLVRNVVLNPTCVLARREALEDIGGFSDLPWEDWDAWLRLAKHHRVGFVDRPLAYVRRHEGSLTPADGRDGLAHDVAILERHIGDVEPRWKRTAIRQRALSNAYLNAGTTLLAHGEHRAARRFAFLALVCAPAQLTRRKLALATRTFAVNQRLARMARRLVLR